MNMNCDRKLAVERRLPSRDSESNLEVSWSRPGLLQNLGLDSPGLFAAALQRSSCSFFFTIRNDRKVIVIIEDKTIVKGNLFEIYCSSRYFNFITPFQNEEWLTHLLPHGPFGAAIVSPLGCQLYRFLLLEVEGRKDLGVSPNCMGPNISQCQTILLVVLVFVYCTQ